MFRAAGETALWVFGLGIELKMFANSPKPRNPEPCSNRSDSGCMLRAKAKEQVLTWTDA